MPRKQTVTIEIGLDHGLLLSLSSRAVHALSIDPQDPRAKEFLKIAIEEFSLRLRGKKNKEFAEFMLEFLYKLEALEEPEDA